MLRQRKFLGGKFTTYRFGRRRQQAHAFGRCVRPLLRDLGAVGRADRMRQHHDRKPVMTLATRNDLAQRAE
jgi:hypothetical protein